MSDAVDIQGKDIPMEELVPVRTRNINLATNRGFVKILSSIRAVGLIEPLCVYPEDGKHHILDGFLRYKACESLGLRTVPCIIYKTKEAYTFDRMVNSLSPVQETKMLRTSLKTLDEATIAEVFGLRSIKYRLGTNAIKLLHPEVVKALDDSRLSRKCAEEFTHVKHRRQITMLREMGRNNDHSLSFARALVLKTPESLRTEEEPKKKRKAPWLGNASKGRDLVNKLEAVTKQHDFFTNLYRDYSTDLLRLCIYVRKLVTSEKIRAHLVSGHAETLARIEGILFETEGKKAGEAADKPAVAPAQAAAPQ
ncbi:MAG TPA: ParB N-terminal domain-containing protein [Planctomycetota bacterium]|nr:ParB N-terminal domain-containing protein [Planctomycetota bacterium]